MRAFFVGGPFHRQEYNISLVGRSIGDKIEFPIITREHWPNGTPKFGRCRYELIAKDDNLAILETRSYENK